jgi:uncharacterized protein (TIGR03435 family)
MSSTRLAILLTAAAAFAQSQPPASSLKFEVASIKPSGPQSVRGSEGGPGSKDPTHYRFQSATMKDLIGIAYHVHYFQMSSKTALDKDRYDVVVNVPEGSSKEEFRGMMRNLLVDRFHFQAHLESKEFPAYEMVVAKTGLKIHESDSTAPPLPHQDGFPDLPAGRPGMISNNSTSNGYWLVRLRAQQEPFSVLADMMADPNEPPIIDKTGLTGKYDFMLEYVKDLPSAHSAEASTPTAPALFTAVQQQLGLQLVAKKLPFDVVVVESFERTPTEN